MKSWKQLDRTTLLGLLLSFFSIAAGLLIEGGALLDILQWPAALIVLGGTAGAVLLQTPWVTLSRSFHRLRQVFLEPFQDAVHLTDEIVVFAIKARRSKLLALEDEAAEASDPFLRKGLSMAVDGAKLPDIQRILEMELIHEEERGYQEAQVFEAAGGFAPTIGILGAVLGLIQVMKNLSHTDQIGHGIATAFVATVYGVGFANLVFLPIANKIRARLLAERMRRELMLEGISAIVEGVNPKLIRERLETFTQSDLRSPKSSAIARRQEAAA